MGLWQPQGMKSGQGIPVCTCPDPRESSALTVTGTPSALLPGQSHKPRRLHSGAWMEQQSARQSPSSPKEERGGIGTAPGADGEGIGGERVRPSARPCQQPAGSSVLPSCHCPSLAKPEAKARGRGHGPSVRGCLGHGAESRRRGGWQVCRAHPA